MSRPFAQGHFRVRLTRRQPAPSPDQPPGAFILGGRARGRAGAGFAWSKNTQDAAGNRGFTLLEILIALTLFAILMAALFGGLRLGSRVWEVTSERLDQDSQILTLRRFLEQRLEEAVPVIGGTGASGGQIIFGGEPSRLRLVSTMPASLGDGFFFLEISIRQRSEQNRTGDLVLVWRPWPIDDAAGSGERIILDDLAALSISYYGRFDRDAQQRWHDQWENTQSLPELIQAKLDFPAGDQRQWRPLIVSPWIDEWYDTTI